MAAKFTRAAPSPRYGRLVQQYELMHLHGETNLGIAPEMVRYEFRLAYLKADQLKEKLLRRS